LIKKLDELEDNTDNETKPTLKPKLNQHHWIKNLLNK
jgi:hypothetical protein